jgi:regulator of sirC expression with transglutaminase-like and TPR domain
MQESEVNALIHLIDDPDETIYDQIKDRLISFGDEVIPALEDVWEDNSYGLLFQTRIEHIIHEIQFGRVTKGLLAWTKNGSEDLLDGMLWVAKYQYPDLDEEKIRKVVAQIKQDVWIELNDNLTAFEKVRVINHVLFDIYGFSGNKTNFHAPQNSYINNVLDSKKGNPLSISVIYMYIAQQLDIPIFGINLPNHFVLAYKEEYTLLNVLGQEETEEIFFYINPFSRGAIFNRKEIDEFLKQLKLSPDPKFYEPCNNLDVLKRLLNNLSSSYDKLGYPDKIADLKHLSDALEGSSDDNPIDTDD